jgi:hypothetical protein
MIEIVTLDELKAEVFSQEEIEDLDEMIIYISDETDEPYEGEAEAERLQEERKSRIAIFARYTLILRRVWSIFLTRIKRRLPFLKNSCFL